MTADEPAEQTFADVLNGLTRGGRVRPSHSPAAPASVPPSADSPEDESIEEAASIVRAYAWTGGRTRSTAKLEIETLVSTTARAQARMDGLRSEHQAVAQLCRQTKSVAEIGALLSLPLGVVRVLLSDMADLGLVEVHESGGDGERPDIELLNRVLRGLSNLRG
jgi:hypothetical protein